MKTKQVFEYFGSKYRTASVLQLTHSAVLAWGRIPPRDRQIEIWAISDDSLIPEKSVMDWLKKNRLQRMPIRRKSIRLKRA